jgi:hypothetical protein
LMIFNLLMYSERIAARISNTVLLDPVRMHWLCYASSQSFSSRRAWLLKARS